MDTLTLIVEGLRYSLPAGLVLGAVWFVHRHFQKTQQINQLAQVKLELMKQQLPVRLTAYERAILYLDRIRPEHILSRLPTGGLTASELHYELVSTVRGEYEHNMAQQLYISPDAWQRLLSGREEVLTLYNTVRTHLDADAPAQEYARAILETAAQAPPESLQSAINLMKREVASLLQM